jgi:hypothetical protein
LRVVFQSTEKQVGRVYTRWIVAVVKNVHSFWNWAIRCLVGETVGKNLTSAVDLNAVPILLRLPR